MSMLQLSGMHCRELHVSLAGCLHVSAHKPHCCISSPWCMLLRRPARLLPMLNSQRRKRTAGRQVCLGRLGDTLFSA